MTVAAFMDLALYDPRFGYYARAAQRSGRAGDFFTSVDVGPVFGELLARQLAEMDAILNSQFPIPHFDVVEAGAGNGRLSADILRAARTADEAFYGRIRLHLVEDSAVARAGQAAALGEHLDRLASSGASLPDRFEGVLLANELLDALPTHQVVMRRDGLREIFVAADPDSDRLVTREGAPSTPLLAQYFASLGVVLEPGWKAEVNLRAVEWVANAATRLTRGFMIFIDYGHDARDLYAASHADGTLTTFARHTAAGPESSRDTSAWLRNPGSQDITAHVDFTSIRAAAGAAGMTTIGFLDQTYFLMGILSGSAGSNHLDHLNLDERLALKTLLVPGGLGSTHKVLILGKGVGAPALAGCSYRMRVT